MTPLSIVVWFNRAFRNLGLHGCSSHSGRRTFITRAARLVHGAVARCAMPVARWSRSIPNNPAVIDGDTGARSASSVAILGGIISRTATRTKILRSRQRRRWHLSRPKASAIGHAVWGRALLLPRGRDWLDRRQSG